MCLASLTTLISALVLFTRGCKQTSNFVLTDSNVLNSPYFIFFMYLPYSVVVLLLLFLDTMVNEDSFSMVFQDKIKVNYNTLHWEMCHSTEANDALIFYFCVLIE